MDCKTWRELASDYIEGALDARMADAMQRHASVCHACRADEAALRTIHTELNVLPTVDPPLFFRENLIAAIERGENGARRPVAGSFWQSLFPRLGRVAVGTLLAGSVGAALLWGVLVPHLRIVPGTFVATTSPALIPGILPGINPADDAQPQPRLHIGHVLTVLPQGDPSGGQAYDFSIWLENADKGVARFHLIGDKQVYHFALGSGMAPQTLRVPLSAAQGQSAVALQVNWVASGQLHSKYLFVPVTRSDDRVPDRHQTFSLGEDTVVDAARELSGRYDIPVTLEDLTPVAANERIMLSARDETASEVLRRYLSDRGLQVTVSGAGVLVAPKAAEDEADGLSE